MPLIVNHLFFNDFSIHDLFGDPSEKEDTMALNIKVHHFIINGSYQYNNTNIATGPRIASDWISIGKLNSTVAHSVCTSKCRWGVWHKAASSPLTIDVILCVYIHVHCMLMMSMTNICIHRDVMWQGRSGFYGSCKKKKKKKRIWEQLWNPETRILYKHTLYCW